MIPLVEKKRLLHKTYDMANICYTFHKTYGVQTYDMGTYANDPEHML